MSEAWFFDTALPLLAFIGIFVIPLVVFIRRQVVERTRPRRERQHGGHRY